VYKSLINEWRSTEKISYETNDKIKVNIKQRRVQGMRINIKIGMGT